MKRFGRNDAIFLVILLALCGLLFAAFYLLPQKSGGSVTVTVDGQTYGSYSLRQDQTIEIKNAEGTVTNVLVISGGEADMTEADCPDKLCVHESPISRNHQTIVCLPNKVVAAIEDGEDAEVDIIVQ